MAAQEPLSEQGKRQLSGVSGLGRVVEVQVYTGSLFVTAAAPTQLFVKTTMGNSAEAIVTGLYYLWAADDYITSTIAMVTFNAQDTSPIGTAVATDNFSPPFTIPAPASGWRFPSGFGGGYVAPGEGVGLQIKSGESVTLAVKGWIEVLQWNVDDRKIADEQLKAMGYSGAPWAKAGRVLTQGSPQ